MATIANARNVGDKLENTRRCFDELYRRFLTPPGEQSLLSEALQELSMSIQELIVTTEELQQENNELAATRVLLQSERRHFQELFEAVPDGYLVTDPRGIIKEANSNAAKLLRTRQDFLAGKPIFIYIVKKDRATLFENLTRLERGEALLHWETEMRPRDGAVFHAAVTIAAVRDLAAAGQALVGLRWLILDVTKRWSAERQIDAQLTRISVLRDINLAITSTLHLRTVLDVLLDRVTLLFPYPIATTVRLIMSETQELAHIISRGLNNREWQAHTPSSPAPRTVELLRCKLPVMAWNVQTDPDSRAPDFYVRNGLVSYLGVPLTVQGQVLGILGLYTKTEHEFTKDEIDSFSALAVQAAIAIHNSQLYEKLKNQTVELQKAHDGLELRVEERTSALARAIAELVVPRSTAHCPAATRSRSLTGLKTRVRSAAAYLRQASAASMLQVTIEISEKTITIKETK
jgi:PAS domain S-box-containing protein